GAWAGARTRSTRAAARSACRHVARPRAGGRPSRTRCSAPPPRPACPPRPSPSDSACRSRPCAGGAAPCSPPAGAPAPTPSPRTRPCARRIARDRPLRALAAELGRTEGALRVRAHTLGLLTGDRRRRWTLREDGLLREGYERGLGCEAVARLMLGGTRTASAVSARARRLGLVSYARTWSGEEEAALRRAAAANASLYAVAERHGRPPQ